MDRSSSKVPALEFLKMLLLETTVTHLEALDVRELLEAVKSDVGNGNHLNHF